MVNVLPARTALIGGDYPMETDTRTLFRSQTLVGRKVINERGQDLGEIEELVIDPDRGCIEYAVLSFGGLFGAGEKFFALPWEALRIDTAHNDFVMDVDREVLEKGQGFDPDTWPSQPDRHTFPSDASAHETPRERAYPASTGRTD